MAHVHELMVANLVQQCHKHGPGFHFSIRASTRADADFQIGIAGLEDRLHTGVGQVVPHAPAAHRVLARHALQANAALEEAFDEDLLVARAWFDAIARATAGIRKEAW